MQHRQRCHIGDRLLQNPGKLAVHPGLSEPCLQVVLGTESGMITAIVRRVQTILRASGRTDVDVEIVFPVASEAITTNERTFESLPAGSSATFPEGLSVLPGVTQGEGCSAEGGCASCPYMKMNSLQYALLGTHFSAIV